LVSSGLTSQRNGALGQAPDAATLVAGEVRMRAVLGRLHVGQLEARHLVAELRLYKQPRLREREKVAVGRRSFEADAREALGQLRMARGELQLRELAKEHHPLLRHADPLADQQPPEVITAKEPSLA